MPADGPAREAGRGVAPAGLKPLFEELGDLKRVRSAGREGSIAVRLFRSAWAGLLDGDAADATAMRVTAAAVAAARLGDLDADMLAAAGLSADEARAVQHRAVLDLGPTIDAGLCERLVAAAGLPAPAGPVLPAFVGALERQPRAGATCPGRPRIVLEPPENHAEHCLMVAVYGVLLAPAYGAEPATVFVAGLAHHLHNAAMPDSGFTGEMLLGEHLGPMMAHCTDAALAELPAGLRADVETARRVLPDTSTPEGRAFHAADVADRVLQIAQHLRAASLTMDVILGEMALVHEGPVKAFQDRVLAEMGLP